MLHLKQVNWYLHALKAKSVYPPLGGGHISSSHAQWYWKFLVPLFIPWSDTSPEWHLRLFKAMEAPFQLPLGRSVHYHRNVFSLSHHGMPANSRPFQVFLASPLPL